MTFRAFPLFAEPCPRTVDGYHVRDLLDRGKTQTVRLNDCNTRVLRGTAGKEANLYFRTKIPR